MSKPERADFQSLTAYFGSKRVDKGSERDDLGGGGANLESRIGLFRV